MGRAGKATAKKYDGSPPPAEKVELAKLKRKKSKLEAGLVDIRFRAKRIEEDIAELDRLLDRLEKHCKEAH